METTIVSHHTPWNKGKLVGQKAPLKLKEILTIRVRLQLGNDSGAVVVALGVYRKPRRNRGQSLGFFFHR